MSRALGKEIKEFYLDDSEPYDGHEECEIVFDDVNELIDDQLYELTEFGVLLVPDSDKWIGFQYAFKKWQRKQTHQKFLISVPKEDIEKVKAVLKQFKGVKVE